MATQHDDAELTRRAQTAFVYLKAALKTLDGEPLPQDIFALLSETSLLWDDPDTREHALAALLAKDLDLAQALAHHPLLQSQV